MTDPNNDASLAARMYPDMATTPAQASPPKETPAADAAPSLAERMYPGMGPQGAKEQAQGATTPAPQKTLEEVAGEPLTPAEQMYGDGAPAPEDGDYSHALSGAFDPLEQKARYDHNEADAQALAEGRTAVNTLMAELSVPLDVGRAVADELAQWHGREPQSAEQVAESGAKAAQVLRREWGTRYDANIQFAQAAAKQAMDRLPWLRDLIEDGAGNSPDLIRKFALIGRRQARQQRSR